MKRLGCFLLLFIAGNSAFAQWASFIGNTSNWINCGDLDVSGNQLTVEALITMTGASPGENIVSKHTGPANVNYLLRPGGFEITTTNGYTSVGSSVGIAMNTTYHVAATYDGSFVRYYVNGCLTGQTAWTGNMVQNNLLTAIGNQSNCQCEPFTGYIDEVRIWNVARTSAQLQANMNTLPTPGAQVGLMAYYNMNGTYINQQGNAIYDGAVVGAVPFAANPFDTTPLQVFNSISTIVNVDCNGSPDGSIDIATAGGNTNYQYSLNGGPNQGSNNFTNLGAGNYTVTVTSADNNCVQQLPITITQPAPLAINIASQTNVSCFGGNDGALTLSASGGTNPGTYSWSPNVSSTNTASNLPAGSYTVTLTDNVCHSSGTELVNNGNFSAGNTGFSSSYVYTPPPNSAAAQYWVGTGPQTGSWNPGMFSNGDHTSGIGNYMQVNGAGVSGTSVWCETIPVTANTNYNFSTWVSSLNNSSPAILEFSINGVPIAASFTAPATWGTWQQFTASWNSGAATSANICIVNLNTSPGGNDFGLDDISFQSCLNQCSTTTVITITEPPVLSNTLTANSATICVGNNSVLTNAISGGTAPYTTTWSNGGSIAGTPVTTTVSPVSTTIYTASVVDAKGCPSNAVATVNVNPLPTPVANSNSPVCENQTLNLNGSGALTYTWAGPGAYSSTVQNPGIANATVAMSGTYTLTVTDANGCVNSTTTPVTVNPLPTVTVNSSTICAGIQTATLTANGANTYAWSPATGLSSTSGTSVNANPGTTTTYTITGTDANGCVNSGTATVTVNALPVLNLTNGFICNGSSVTLTANGAVTYTWSPSGSLSSANGNNVTAFPSSTTNYTVVGTDANGCFNADTTTVTVVNNPTVTVASATLCVGQIATLTANGAVSYVWGPATGLSSTTGSSVNANPGTTTVYTITGTVGTCTAVNTCTVTVNNLPAVNVNTGTICLGQQTFTLIAGGANTYTWTPGTGLSSTFGSNVNATPNVTTNYTVTGTDVNNCVNTATTSVVVNPLPNVTVNSGLICSGGSMVLNANGASTYAWSPGTGLSSTSGNSVTANPNSTTVYTISGTDANTCTNTATGTVTVVNNPTVSVNNASICLGQQTAVLTANGATSYAWSPATGLSATSGSSVNANPNTTTSYTITGTIGTCTALTTCTVSVNPLPTITAASTVICNNASATLTANGASTYTWSTLAQGNSITVSPSSTTTYSVAGTNANGCNNFTTTTVTVNPLPNVTVNSAAICAGASVILTANNAVVCTWSPPTGLSTTVGNSVNANPNTTTQYTVTGTDANGCSNTALSTVTVHQLPNVNVNSTTICKGSSATLSAGGANIYNWNPGTGLSNSNVQNPTASPNTTTTYTVTGTDINNCTDTAIATVTVNQLPLVAVNPATTSGCAPLCVNFSNTGTSSVNAIYNWNFGNGTLSTSQASQSCYQNAGTYTTTLIVTDSNGCKNSSTSIINVFPVPKANFAFNPPNATILNPQIQFYDLSTNATIAIWNWNFGDNDSSQIKNPLHVYGDTGLYYPHLTVFSDHGCWDIIWEVLYIAPEYLLYVPNAFTPNGDNDNEVFLPKGEGIKEYTLRIYDRWGMELFKSTDINTGWDGKKNGEYLMQDVYVWNIELKNINGEPKHLAGTVSLIK